MKDIVLSEQIRTTKLFISEEGRDVALSREGTFARTEAGGQVKGGIPETSVAVRRLFMSLARDQVLTVQWQGKRVDADHILIGLPDDPMKEGDTFVLDGRKFTIVFVNTDERWQTKGYVIEHAG